MSVLYESETKTVAQSVQEKIAEFIESPNGDFNITTQAKELLVSILGAVLFDPHPTWNIGRGTEHSEFYETCISKIPIYLKEISKLKTVKEKSITSFDVLHWLSTNLDSICPFKK